MDALLSQLVAFPPHPPPNAPLTEAEYDKQIKSLVQHLNQIPTNNLTVSVPGGGDLLDILDPSINTLSYLYVLHAHITAASGKQPIGAAPRIFSYKGPLWLKMLEFMERFDPIQIRYGGTEFRRLIELVARTAQVASKPLIAISPIRSAILRLVPSSSCFTTSHLLFVRLCLEAREYQDALPVLENDIYHFPLAQERGAVHINSRYLCANQDSRSTFLTSASGLSDKLDPRDHLQYFLLGAMIYIGAKNWVRALLFLDIVLTSPVNNTTSMIQVEAYKKWVLVNLLHQGFLVHFPRTTNSLTTKLCVALAKPYESLARVFEEGITQETSARRLILESDAARSIWREDYNTGLVIQVIDAFRRFSILKLEKTYVALRISDVTQRTSPEPHDHAETASYVTFLITSGHLNATLVKSAEEPQAWILRFATSSARGPQARSEQQQYEELVKQTRRTIKLTDHVRELDRRLGLSKEYVDWARKLQKSREAGGSGELNSFVGGGDEYLIDEDMMADL